MNVYVCPKVLFTGIKVNYNKELSLEFGTYCEVYDGTDNTAKSRSVPCIALYPSNNSTGSWEFINLKTKMRIRRLHWVKMKTSDLIINIMNHFKDKVGMMPQEVEQTPVQVSAEPSPAIQSVSEQEPAESIPVAEEVAAETPEAVVGEVLLEDVTAEKEEAVSSRTRA